MTVDTSFATETGGRGNRRECYHLNLSAEDIPLEDELRRALSGGVQRIWGELRPHGTVDQVDVDLVYHSASEKLNLEVTAQESKKSQEIEGRAIAIEPQWFPYRLDNLRGILHYRDGEVELIDIAGQHGKTELSLAGRCTFSGNGAWLVNLQKLSAERIVFDHELTTALPGSLGASVRKLNISGPLNLNGALQVWGQAAPGVQPAAKWDLAFDLENGNLNAGLNLQHIHGSLRLDGAIDAGGFHSRGALDVDSLIYNEVQFTQVKGPLWVDQRRVLFGRWAARATGGEPAPLEAKVFSGTLSGSAEVAAVGDNDFSVQLALNDARLESIAQEMTARREPISGRAFAAVELRGSGKGTHTWRGGGMVRLGNADIYRLPQMLALLKVLSLQPPDKTAFDTGDVDFHIQGDHIYLDRINFTGDAITLKGAGWVSLDRQIDIDFYTMVGRDRFRIPIITPALGAVSRELLLIHASGTVDDPKLGRKSLPGLNERLKQLFPESQANDSILPSFADRPQLFRWGNSPRH